MSMMEFCSTHVITAHKNEHVRNAAKLMADKNVGAVVVVDNHAAPVGILTDRDIVTKVVSLGKNAETTLVTDIMTPHVTTLREDQGLMEASRVMMEHGVRRLPVVGKGGKVVGILTVDDVLMVLERELNNLSQTISMTMKAESHA